MFFLSLVAPGPDVIKPPANDDQVQNERSDILAMALGVQIKKGEDPPTGEIVFSGYAKKQQQQQQEMQQQTHFDKLNQVNARLLKMAGHDVSRQRGDDREQRGRNKFQIEKPQGDRDRR